MKNFIYNTPTKVWFGKDEEKNIGKIIKEYGFKRILFHYGMSSIKKSGLYDVVLNSLKEYGIEVYELGGVEANPKIDLCRQGVKIVKENNIEMILAVGGGSVIDSAKSIAVGSLVDFDPWLFNSHEQVATKHIPVGVILTISASGSAMSDSCVISNPQIKVKKGFNSQENRPLFAILNPCLTYTVSKYQTACGVVDIMMHTLERYFSKDEGFEITNSIALSLLKDVKKYGLIAYNNPCDYEARANLMWAECLSHNGLTGVGNDYCFSLHPLEHEVSALYDRVSHGAGLAALFAGYSKTVYKNCLDKFVNLGLHVFELDNKLSKEEIALKTIEEFEKFFKEINMPTGLSELQVYDDSFKTFALNVTNNKTRVIKDVVDIDYDMAMTIYNNSK